MKVLNLFAGIGGGRSLWDQIPDIQITAIEINPLILNVYQKRFLKDICLCGDAYSFIEEHLDEYDLIWASPPCQTHSRLNITFNVKPKLPDFRLYSLITYLMRLFRGNWLVENVIPYYEPLIKPVRIIERHYIWSNCSIPNQQFHRKYSHEESEIPELIEEYRIDDQSIISLKENFNRMELRQILRNCVLPEEGLFLLRQLLKNKQKCLFDMGKTKKGEPPRVEKLPLEKRL